MEKIDTDYKRRILKIEAELFDMRKPWRSSFKLETLD